MNKNKKGGQVSTGSPTAVATPNTTTKQSSAGENESPAFKSHALFQVITENKNGVGSKPTLAAAQATGQSDDASNDEPKQTEGRDTETMRPESDDEDMSDSLRLQRLDSDVVLPQATVKALIQEKLPEGEKMSNDAKNFLITLSMHFLSQVANKSNHVCSDRGRKTIQPEHVIDAMDEMHLHEYLIKIALNELDKKQESAKKTPTRGKRAKKTPAEDSVRKYEKQHRDLIMTRLNQLESSFKKNRAKMSQNDAKNHGLSAEELIKQQNELFSAARQCQQSQQQLQHMESGHMSAYDQMPYMQSASLPQPALGQFANQTSFGSTVPPQQQVLGQASGQYSMEPPALNPSQPQQPSTHQETPNINVNFGQVSHLVDQVPQALPPINSIDKFATKIFETDFMAVEEEAGEQDQAFSFSEFIDLDDGEAEAEKMNID